MARRALNWERLSIMGALALTMAGCGERVTREDLVFNDAGDKVEHLMDDLDDLEGTKAQSGTTADKSADEG